MQYLCTEMKRPTVLAGRFRLYSNRQTSWKKGAAKFGGYHLLCACTFSACLKLNTVTIDCIPNFSK